MKKRHLIKLGARLAGNTLAEVLRKAGGPPLHRPKRIYLETSVRCNLKCLHCGKWQAKTAPRQLSVEEWSRVITGAREWLGPYYLSFRSAEPFMDAGIFRLIKTAADLGVVTRCTSNGTLINEEMARKIADSGLSSLSISIDSLRPEIHDAGRGSPGTLKRAVRGILALRRLKTGPKIYINTIVTSENLAELGEIVSWARELGLAGNLFQALQPLGSSWRRLWPEDAGAVDRALAELREAKKNGAAIVNHRAHFDAMAAYYRGTAAPGFRGTCSRLFSVSVDVAGEVTLCPEMPSIGNVRGSGLRELWESAAAAAVKRRIPGCRANCFVNTCNTEPSMGERLGSYFILFAGKL